MGGDDDLDVAGDGRRGEALDVVELGELAVVVVGEEGHELLLGLFAEIAGVDEKENALGTFMLEQSVDLRDSGEGLAGTRGHLNERARPACLQRSFEFRDGPDLALAQTVGVEWRERSDARPKGSSGLHPRLECPWTVEGKDLPGAWIGVASVGEPRNPSRALVEKGQGLGVGDPLESGVGVALRLLFNGRETLAPGVRLGFHDAGRLPVAKEDIVGGTGVGRVLAHRDPRACVEIEGVPVLHLPARSPEAIVDPVAGDLFGILVDVTRHGR